MHHQVKHPPKKQQGRLHLSSALLMLTLLAILLAIAIPGYRIYQVRNKIVHYIALLDEAKTAATQFYAQHHRLPCSEISNACVEIDEAFAASRWIKDGAEFRFSAMPPAQKKFGVIGSQAKGSIEMLIPDAVVPGKSKVLLASIALPSAVENTGLIWQCMTLDASHPLSMPGRYLPNECTRPHMEKK